MVGRLARYLRFVGCDTEYVRGLSDEEVLRKARAEGRVILTRDRDLASRADRALLLTSPFLPDQWRAVRAAYPDLPSDVQFKRCTECNGVLERVDLDSLETAAPGVPWDRVREGLPLYRCRSCGHYYWEGSHTSEIRARIAKWNERSDP